MFEFTDYLDKYDLWNPLSVLTLTGILLAVANIVVTKKLGSGPLIFMYSAAYGILAIAMAWGYVILSEAGSAPRLGQILVFGAIDFLLASRIALTAKMAGSIKQFASTAPMHELKPIDAMIGETKDAQVLRTLSDVKDTVHEIRETTSEIRHTTNSKMDLLLNTVGEAEHAKGHLEGKAEEKAETAQRAVDADNK